MENRTLQETFASEPRMRILNLMTTTPISASRIAEEVGLTPTTVRFHLQKLLRFGLVEEVEKRGLVGRPRLLYRATGKRIEFTFPARNYMRLSEVLVQTLTSVSDQSAVRKQLRRVGRNLDSQLGRYLIEKTGQKNWDAGKFGKHFVEGMLNEFGAQPEIVKQTDSSVQYRMNNCPFKELAVKYPRVICEELDDNLNKALCKELDPGIDWKKMRCMGHGDPYCEYLATWD